MAALLWSRLILLRVIYNGTLIMIRAAICFVKTARVITLEALSVFVLVIRSLSILSLCVVRFVLGAVLYRLGYTHCIMSNIMSKIRRRI